MSAEGIPSCFITVAAVTHCGLVRASNQDAVGIEGVILTGQSAKLEDDTRPDNVVLMIADGMGGHASGELASLSTIEYLNGRIKEVGDLVLWSDVLKAANDYLYDLMTENPGIAGSGTTLVGVDIDRTRLLHFNIGDSRAYRHVHGRLILLSHDDVPNRAEGQDGRRMSHQITQSIGGHLRRTAIFPHVGAAPPLGPGERILLCSDGLTDMVSDADIRNILDEPLSPRDHAEKLLQLALECGGHDNISIVVAQYGNHVDRRGG
jgi:protein phosphatase